MLMYLILGAVYTVVLGPIVLLLGRTLDSFSTHSRQGEIFEGIAVSCLIAICTALLLTSGVGVRGGLLVWIAYLATTGVAIWLPAPIRLRDVIACAIAPSLVLLGSFLAVYLLPLWLGQAAGAVVSSEVQMQSNGPSLVQALSLTLFVSLMSVLGTAVGVYARAGVVRIFKTLFALKPASFGKIEKIVNTCLRIGAAIAAVFAVARA